MLIPRQLAQQRPPHLRGDLPLVLPRHVDRIVDVHPQLAPSVLDREESHGGEHRVGVRQTQRHDGHARLDREAEHPPLEFHEPPVRTARALRERHYRHAILEVLPRALEHAELRSLVVAVDEEVFPLFFFRRGVGNVICRDDGAQRDDGVRCIRTTRVFPLVARGQKAEKNTDRTDIIRPPRTTHPHQLPPHARELLEAVLGDELERRPQGAADYGDVEERRVVRHEQARAAAAGADAPPDRQPIDVPPDGRVASRRAQVGAAPDLPDGVELAPIVVETRERIAQRVHDLEADHPKGHRQDDDEEVMEAVEVQDLGIAGALRLEFEHGPHLVDGEDVRRWWRGRRGSPRCRGRRRRRRRWGHTGSEVECDHRVIITAMMAKELEIAVMMRRWRRIDNMDVDRLDGG